MCSELLRDLVLGAHGANTHAFNTQGLQRSGAADGPVLCGSTPWSWRHCCDRGGDCVQRGLPAIPGTHRSGSSTRNPSAAAAAAAAVAAAAAGPRGSRP